MENKDKKPAGNGSWQVMRQDSNGVVYIIRKDLSEEFARALLKTYNGTHKQDWWAEETQPGINDHYLIQ